MAPYDEEAVGDLSAELVEYFQIPALINALPRSDMNYIKNHQIFKSLVNNRKSKSRKSSLLSLEFQK